MKHVMVDLETMGSTSGSVIVSLGACGFGPSSQDEPSPTFYENIDINSCLEAGLHCDGKTIEWWMKRSDQARQALFVPEPKRLGDVLGAFYDFIRGISGTFNALIWAHGATFDPPLLDVAYSKCGITLPWKYWNVRDTRTIYDAAKYRLPKVVGDDVHHHALADAVRQAKGVQECYSRLVLWRDDDTATGA